MNKNAIKTYSRRSFLRTSSTFAICSGLFPSILKNSGLADAKPKHITLLHTSDIHGQTNVHDEFFWENETPVFRKRGGLAHLKTMIAEFRRQNPHTLLFDCGDFFQGSAIAALSEGEVLIPLINNLGYDAILPGNWEVVYGKQKLIKNMNACKATKVCTNMYHEHTNEFVFAPYQVLSAAGIRIGLIGYTDPLTAVRQSPAYSYGLQFCEAEKNLARYIQLLKHEKQCDLIIALSHMGMAQQILLSDQPYAKGLNYIFGGDTHERIHQPIEGKFAKVMEPGAFGSFLGKLDLIIENGKIINETYELLEVDPEKFKADDEMLALIYKAYQPYQKEIKVAIGKTTTPLHRYFILETPMDNLITDALMWKAKPDIALSNGFRFSPALVPDGESGTAEITKEFLWSMLPVNSEVKMGQVTGQELVDWLEQEIENVFSRDASKRFGGWLVRFKGMKMKFAIKNEPGNRLQEVLINDKRIDLNHVYSIVACEREGDPDNTLCRMKNVRQPHRLGYSLHATLEEYLQANSPVSPRVEGRAIAVDGPATLLTQWTGRNYEFE